MVTIPSGDPLTSACTHWIILVAGNDKMVIIKNWAVPCFGLFTLAISSSVGFPFFVLEQHDRISLLVLFKISSVLCPLPLFHSYTL